MITKSQAVFLVLAELDSANEKFPPFTSSHEGYAIILEELDELWFEIKNNKNPQSLVLQKKEATQVAAMAIKFIMSCCKEHL